MVLRVGTNYVRQLLNACEEVGHTMIVSCEGEVDYRGHHAASAEEAIIACDEADLTIRDRDRKKVGWALIVNGLAEDERIADCSGLRLENWLKENIP